MTTKKKVLAGDIMQKHVVRLDPDMAIDRAIATLEENEISGAPVVDGSDRLVGVLTTADVSRSEHVRAGRIEAARGAWEMTEPQGESEEDDTEWVVAGMEDYNRAVKDGDTVADWMHRGVVTVDPTDSLASVCRTMVRNRIHRVVVARGGAIEGILTSSDVVRWVAETQ